jgi:septal ring factor EnvC (AmiA/AmiB activator)
LRAHFLNLQAKLTKPHKKRDALFATLKRAEQAIRQSTQRLMRLDQQILNKDNHFQALKTKYNRLQVNHFQQHETFIKKIHSAYITSHHKIVKLLLSQQNLTSFRRHAPTYFNYFHRSQSYRIAQIFQNLETIEKLQDAMQDEQTHLFQLLKGGDQSHAMAL